MCCERNRSAAGGFDAPRLSQIVIKLQRLREFVSSPEGLGSIPRFSQQHRSAVDAVHSYEGSNHESKTFLNGLDGSWSRCHAAERSGQRE